MRSSILRQGLDDVWIRSARLSSLLAQGKASNAGIAVGITGLIACKTEERWRPSLTSFTPGPLPFGQGETIAHFPTKGLM
ncbi:MAG: hypothetical protein NZ840_04370 [Anaerolineales bacterium]|nr:hypothetical protein [Anaerolineales bacterium]MDW8161270.1 hypothetical protein [Anaerolineales bacterium]